MNALALALALVCAAKSDENTPLEHPVPAWLPRGAEVGIFINAPAVAPHVRLQWDLTIYESQRDAFVGVFAVGSAFGVALPAGMTEHYQHVLLAGAGYRNNAQLIQWGFQISLGPVWYRTAYAPQVPYYFENRVLGYAEGRLQGGLHVLPHLVVGLYFGFASPWSFSIDRYPGNNYVGGFDLGAYLDWR